MAGARWEAGWTGGLTSVSRQVHWQVGLAGPRRSGRVSPPHLLLGCLLHLLVVVIPAESRAGIRDSPAALGWGWGNGGGGAVPGQLVPSDVVHEAVAHVQPPARLAAEPRPGIRRRRHREPWARSRRRRRNGCTSHPPAGRGRHRLSLAFRPRTPTFRRERAVGPSGAAR